MQHSTWADRMVSLWVLRMFLVLSCQMDFWVPRSTWEDRMMMMMMMMMPSLMVSMLVPVALQPVVLTRQPG